MRRTSGHYKTDFDEAINATLNTVQMLGATDEQIDEDQEFLVSLMQAGGVPSGETIDTIRILDAMFIGLLVHRHMQYASAEDFAMVRPDLADNGYGETLNLVCASLTEMNGVTSTAILDVMTRASAALAPHTREPDGDDDVLLITQMHTLHAIGWLIKELMPISYPPHTDADDE